MNTARVALPISVLSDTFCLFVSQGNDDLIRSDAQGNCEGEDGHGAKHHALFEQPCLSIGLALWNLTIFPVPFVGHNWLC